MPRTTALVVLVVGLLAGSAQAAFADGCSSG
jgi:hypothetical protein